MEAFQTKDSNFLNLNINRLLPKIDEICFILKHTNASIIGINESKLDSFTFNSELDIEGYDVVRIDPSRREVELYVI